nr:hypothetical protein [Mycobacterium sp. E2462]
MTAAVALVAAIAVAALVVSLTRPSSVKSAAISTPPPPSAGEVAAARQKLCDSYQLAARAVQIETNGTSPERAGIAEVNGAMMLREVADTSPKLAAGDRESALGLAEAYSNVAVRASLATGSDDPAWRSALDQANARDAAMKKVCGGG